MAVQSANQFKTITASGGGTLVAQAGQSLLLTDIFCVPSSSDTFLTLTIGGTTVGKFRVKGKSGNHCAFPSVFTALAAELVTRGLFAELRARGVDLSIPIASGETLTVTRYAEAGNVVLRYTVADAGDYKNTDPNGRLAKVRRYVNYVGNTAAVTALAYADLDYSEMWAGFNAWPAGLLGVPENHRFTLFGLLGCPSGKGASAANKGYTTNIQLIRENNVLFDPDRAGLPFLGDVAEATGQAYKEIASVVGALTAERPRPPLMFDTPLVFDRGESITGRVLITGAAASGHAINTIDVQYIEQVELLG
jgi:hypothetical protein